MDPHRLSTMATTMPMAGTEKRLRAGALVSVPRDLNNKDRQDPACRGPPNSTLEH